MIGTFDVKFEDILIKEVADEIYKDVLLHSEVRKLEADYVVKKGLGRITGVSEKRRLYQIARKWWIKVKYRVYANYVFTKCLGEYEAETEDEAMDKAIEEADGVEMLCCHCGKEFVDHGEIDEDSLTCEEVLCGSD